MKNQVDPCGKLSQGKIKDREAQKARVGEFTHGSQSV